MNIAELRKKFLYKVYELTNADLIGSISFKELEPHLGISQNESRIIYHYLKEKGLVKVIFQGKVTITSLGIDFIEEDMANEYEEKRYKILKALVENGENNHISTYDLAKSLSLTEPETYSILRTFEDKGWVALYEEITTISHRGIEAFYQDKPSQNNQAAINYNTNNYAPSINQIGGRGNTQNAQININPDFAEAIKGLTELVIQSQLGELEKEERLLEIERIKQLGQKEQTAEVKQLGSSKLKLLETSLKAGELALKAAPFIAIIGKAFGL